MPTLSGSNSSKSSPGKGARKLLLAGLISPLLLAASERAAYAGADLPDSVSELVGRKLDHKPRAPVVLVASMKRNMAFVYKGEALVAKAKFNSDDRAVDIPRGVFAIDRMERIKGSGVHWSGFTLHAETDLSGINAFDGLIFPADFSKKFSRLSSGGATLIVADSYSVPTAISDLDFFEESSADSSGEADGWSTVQKLEPLRSIDLPISVVISGEDRKIYVYRGRQLIKEEPVTYHNPYIPLARHAYVVMGRETDTQAINWLAINLAGGGFEIAQDPSRADDVLERFEIEPKLRDRIAALLHRGAVLVVASDSVQRFADRVQATDLAQSQADKGLVRSAELSE